MMGSLLKISKPQSASLKRGSQFMQPQSGGDLGAQGTYEGLCPVDLQSPHCGPYWLGPGLEEAVSLSLPLLPPGSTVCLGCRLQDLLPHPAPHGWPEEPEGQLGLPPCIVRKDPRVPHTARRGA